MCSKSRIKNETWNYRNGRVVKWKRKLLFLVFCKLRTQKSGTIRIQDSGKSEEIRSYITFESFWPRVFPCRVPLNAVIILILHSVEIAVFEYFRIKPINWLTKKRFGVYSTRSLFCMCAHNFLTEEHILIIFFLWKSYFFLVVPCNLFVFYSIYICVKLYKAFVSYHVCPSIRNLEILYLLFGVTCYGILLWPTHSQQICFGFHYFLITAQVICAMWRFCWRNWPSDGWPCGEQNACRSNSQDAHDSS